MSSAADTQARWNGEALAEAWELLGALTREQVLAAGHDPTAALEVDGRYPAVQFDRDVRDAFAQVRQILGGVLGPRSMVLWLTGSSGYLEGALPIEKIAEHPDEVLAAARYQASLGED